MTNAIAGVATHFALDAETAADLMESNLVSLREEATIREAVTLLTDRRYPAVPVINEAGQAVGVVSQADILVHEREDWHSSGSAASQREPVLVRDIMTPAVFSVKTDTRVSGVVKAMADMNVHQLFVVDDDGVVLGIIRATEIVRRLRESPSNG